MKTRTQTAAVLFAGLLACSLVGCDKSSSSGSDTTATTTPSATAPAPAQTAVSIADTDLVTPADMEPQAESTITSANYKAQLASLETEMSKE